MTAVTPVSTQNAPQSTAFKGKNYSKCLNELAGKMKCPSQGSSAEATIEHLNGAIYAMKHPSPAELKETVMRETMLGNTDFVKGINDVLAKDAAKNVYKP